MAGCSWALDGVPTWEQDLWNHKGIAVHPGDLFNVVFADAEGFVQGDGGELRGVL